MSNDSRPSLGNIIQRELKAWFKGVAGYLFGAIILMVTGIFSVYQNLSGLISNFEYAVQGGSLALLPAVILLSLKLHARIHADRLAGPEHLSEDGLSLKTDPVKTRSFAHMQLLKPSQADLSDSLFYRKHLLEGSLKPWQLALGRAIALAVVLLIPVLLLHIYPLILMAFGEVYLLSAYTALWAYYGLGLVLLMTALLITTAQPHPLISLGYLVLSLVLIYTLPLLALYFHSAYAGMLLFTLIILFIAMAVYLLYKNTTAALLVGTVLELVQLVFFLTMRGRFEGLAVRILTLLGPFVRFNNFIGGILDIPALIYFLLVSVVLLILTVEQVSQKKDAYQRDAEAALQAQEGAPKGKSRTLTEQEEDDLSAARRKAADGAALKKLIAPAAAAACSMLVMVLLSFTRTALIKDVTSTGMFSEDPRFRAALEGVKNDTTIYWICQNGAEDASLQTALYYYSRQNPHLIVQKIDPLSHVEFLQTYVVESISNDALLLVSGERSRYLPREELYGQDYTRYEETQTYDLTFQLENMLGHGLAYVSGSGSLPALYEITGHGETALNDYWKVMIQKLDLAVLSSDLASLPGDATMITMVNPTADLSAEEAQKLNSYLEASGQLFLITAPEQDPDSLPRLKEIMDAHGITEVPGIVIESEDHAYSKDAPYSFKPRMLVHPVNEEAGYSEKSVLLSEVQALSVRNTDIATASPLLLSSEDAYSKVDGYNITTYSKEARDISGPLTLAALSEGDHGRIIWIASASIIDEAANETSEGGNRYFIYGALRYFGADASWDPIQPTLYNYGLMRMNETLVSRLGLIFVGVFPIFYLLIGGVFWALKKRAEFILQAEEEEKARQAQEEERRREEQEAEERREAFRKARREAAIKAKEERKKKENRE